LYEGLSINSNTTALRRRVWFLPSLFNFFQLSLFSLSHQTQRRRGEKIAHQLNIIYRYHGNAVLTFVPGLLFDIMSATANPAKKRRENCSF